MSNDEALPTHAQLREEASRIVTIVHKWDVYQKEVNDSFGIWNKAILQFGQELVKIFDYEASPQWSAATRNEPPGWVAAKWFVESAIKDGENLDRCLRMLGEVVQTKGVMGMGSKSEKPVFQAWNRLVKATNSMPSLPPSQVQSVPQSSNMRQEQAALSGESSQSSASYASSRSEIVSSNGPAIVTFDDLTALAKSVAEDVLQIETRADQTREVIASMDRELSAMKSQIAAMKGRIHDLLVSLTSRAGGYYKKEEYDSVEDKRAKLDKNYRTLYDAYDNLSQINTHARDEIIEMIQGLAKTLPHTNSGKGDDVGAAVTRTVIEKLAGALQRSFDVSRYEPQEGETFDSHTMQNAGPDRGKSGDPSQEYVIVRTVVPGFIAKDGTPLGRPQVLIAPAKHK